MIKRRIINKIQRPEFHVGDILPSNPSDSLSVKVFVEIKTKTLVFDDITTNENKKEWLPTAGRPFLNHDDSSWLIIFRSERGVGVQSRPLFGAFLPRYQKMKKISPQKKLYFLKWSNFFAESIAKQRSDTSQNYF